MHLLGGLSMTLLHLTPRFYGCFLMFVEVCVSMLKSELLNLGRFSGFYNIF